MLSGHETGEKNMFSNFYVKQGSQSKPPGGKRKCFEYMISAMRSHNHWQNAFTVCFPSRKKSYHDIKLIVNFFYILKIHNTLKFN